MFGNTSGRNRTGLLCQYRRMYISWMAESLLGNFGQCQLLKKLIIMAQVDGLHGRVGDMFLASEWFPFIDNIFLIVKRYIVL